VKTGPQETQHLPTTKIYSFRSMKGSVQPIENTRKTAETNEEIDNTPKTLPVSETEYIEAIKDLLQKVNMPFDLNQEKLMTELLTLRTKLKEAESKITELHTLEEQHKRDLENNSHSATCPICKENEVSVCLVPCGHVLCEECTSSWAQRLATVKCPFCRREVVQIVKMFKP
jgi:sacsin